MLSVDESDGAGAPSGLLFRSRDKVIIIKIFLPHLSGCYY